MDNVSQWMLGLSEDDKARLYQRIRSERARRSRCEDRQSVKTARNAYRREREIRYLMSVGPEAGLKRDAHTRLTWAPKGLRGHRYPKAKVSTKVVGNAFDAATIAHIKSNILKSDYLAQHNER